MVEEQIEVESRGARLSGTICLPERQGRFPFVLMVHGSGPLDRDENMKGQKLDVFNTIAHHIAAEGIASLRYDKRGCGTSTGQYYRASHTDLVEDAIACFDALARSDVCVAKEIYVLGHSEGSIIAPQMTKKRSSIAGIILLCPFVQRMEVVLVKQAEHINHAIANLGGIKGFAYRILVMLAGGALASQRKLMARVKLSSSPTIRHWFAKIPAKWLREVLTLEPKEILSQVVCPALLIGGSKDVQCDPADVNQIAELSRGVVDSYVIQDMTHILRTDERRPSMFHYGELMKKPVEPQVLNLILDWLRQQTDAKR